MPSSALAARRQAYLQSIKSKRRFSKTMSPNKPVIKSKHQEQQQSPTALTPTQSVQDEKQPSQDKKHNPALTNADTLLPNLLDSRQEHNQDDFGSHANASLTSCHENITHNFISDVIKNSEERVPVSPASSPHCQQVKEGAGIDSVKIIGVVSSDSIDSMHQVQDMADPTSQGLVREDEGVFNDVDPEKAVEESHQMLDMDTLTSVENAVETCPAATDTLMDHLQDLANPASPLGNEMGAINDSIVVESLDPSGTNAVDRAHNLAACTSGLTNCSNFTGYDVVGFKSLKKRAQVKVQTKSATDIQAAYRSFTAHRRYKAFIGAVVTLQSIQRAHPVRVATPHRLALRQYRLNTASMIIQTMYRGYYTRCKYDINGIPSRIIILQSHVRRYSATAAYRKYKAFIQAVITLQSIHRAHPVRVATPHRLALRQHRHNTASTIIQTIYRGYYARCKYDINEIVFQITILQSCVRRHSAIKLRQTLEGLNYLLMNTLVRKIQSTYRRHRHGRTITKRLLLQRRSDCYPDGDLPSLDNHDSKYLTYVLDTSNDDAIFESQCCSVSRCGFSDEMHEILMETGKLIHSIVGDPTDVETAENLVSFMEMSEEVSLGLMSWEDLTTTVDSTKRIGKSSVVIIQSKWRGYVCAKKFSAMKRRRTLLL